MIPESLWKVEYTGYFTYADQITKRADWAGTRWLKQTLGGTGGADAEALATIAHLNYRSTAGGDAPVWCRRTRLVKTRAVHFVSGLDREFEQDVSLGADPQDTPLPVQAAFLIVARTKILGRQTRLWVPGLDLDAMGDDGRFDTAQNGVFNNWAQLQLQDSWNDVGRQWVPIHWSFDDETEEFHTELFWMREWRTIRRRVLRDRSTLP